MNRNTGNFRLNLLLGTAAAGIVAVPGTAHAQLVSAGDLNATFDAAATAGPHINVTNPSATEANIEVLAEVVVADWNQFNVPDATQLTVVNGSGNGGIAALLNRVIGGSPSDLGGTITATDVDLWIINQNGILFGDNTSITANSFVASTLDISNADFFDGPSSSNFSGPSAAGIVSAGTNAQFITDGSLWFVSQNLDLTASFTSTNETVAFITASDVDVAFTPGSPLNITVNAGSTIATGQTVGGTVEGDFAAFHMVSAGGVLDGLLQVDADVTATHAAFTPDGIVLFGANDGADEVSIAAGGALESTGLINVDSDGDVALAQNATGGAIAIEAAGTVQTADLTSSAGAIDVTGDGDVSTGNLTATDGNTSVSSTTGLLDLGDVSSSLDVTLTAATTLNAGVVDAGGNLTATATDALTLASATADSDDDDTGDLTLASTNGPLTVTGASSGASADIDSGGTASLGDVTTTGGALAIDATGDVSTGTLAATGGNTSVASTTGLLDLGDVSSSLDVTITAATTLDAGVVDAGGNLTATATNALALASATADSDDSDTGNLTVATSNGPLSVTGASSGVSADIDSGGTASLGDVTTTGGALAVDAAGDIDTGNLAATGGNTSVASTTGLLDLGDVSSSLDVTLTAATTLDAGVVDAGGNLAATSTGELTLASATADTGDLTLASTNGPLTVTGASSGVSADIDSGGTASLGDVTTTGGALAIDATGDIDTGNLAATGGNTSVASTTGLLDLGDVSSSLGVTLTSATSLAAGAVSAGDNLTATATDGLTLASATADSDDNDTGDLTLASTNGPLTVTGASSGVSADIDSGGTASLGDVTTTGGALAIDATGDIDTGNLAATGGNTSVASTTGLLDLGDVSSSLGVTLTSATSLAAGAVSAGDNLTATATDGLTLASATADSDDNDTGDLTLASTNGPLTVTGVSSGVSADIDSGGTASLGDVTTTGGALAINAAGDIDTGNLAATGGNTSVASTTGLLDLGDVSSSLDVTLTAATTLDTGVVGAGGNLTATATGDLTLGSATADTGDLTLASTNGPLTVTGASSGVSADIDSGGTASLGDVTTTGGALAIDAAGDIDTGNLAATGGNTSVTSTTGLLDLGDVSSSLDVTLTSATTLEAGAVSAGSNLTATSADALTLASATADSDDDDTGDLTLASTNGPLTVTGASSGVSADIDSGGTASLGDVTTTGGALAIDATGDIDTGNLAATDGNTSVASTTGLLDLGDVSSSLDVTLTSATTLAAGAVSAGGNLTATATDDLTLASATADSDDNGTGDLTLASTNGPLTVTGASSGVSADIDSGGTASLGDVTTTGGALAIDATGDIDTGNLAATGGNTSVTSTTGLLDLGDVSSSLDVTLTSATTLAAGAVSAGGNLAATATDDLTLASATADSDDNGTGDLTLASTNGPLTVTGASSGVSADIDSGGTASLGDVTTTGGALAINAAGDIDTGNLAATGGNTSVASTTGLLDLGDVSSSLDVTLTAATTLDTGVVGAGGNLTATATGDLTLGSATADTGDLTLASTNGPLTVTGASSGVSADIDSGGTASLSDVTATGGNLNLQAQGDISFANLVGTGIAGGTILVTSLAGDITGDSSTLSAGSFQRLAAAGDISIGDARSGGSNIFLLAGGSLTATGTIATSLAGDPASGHVLMRSGGATNVQTVSAGDDLFAEAGATFSGGALSAGDDVRVTAPGTITITSATARGTGDDSVFLEYQGASGPNTTTLGSAETLTGSNVIFNSSANAIRSTGDITAANDAILSAATTIDAGSVTAGNDLTATALDRLTLATATADSDDSGTGNLTLTSTSGPLEVTGASSGVAVDIDSGSAATLGFDGNAISLTQSTGGVLDIDAAGPIRTGQIQAVGGNAELTSANGAVTTDDVSSTADVLLNAATRLTSQNVSALNHIVAVSGDNMTLATATADSDDSGAGNLTLTSTNGPLEVSGASSGVAVDIDSGSAATLGFDGNIISLTQSTGGVLDIDAAGVIRTGQIQAVGGNAELTSANGSITTADVSSTQNTLIAAATFINSRNVDANLDVSLVAGTMIEADAVTAGNHITASSEGRLVIGSATANDDGGSIGDLVLTTTAGPLRVAGASSGVSVDIDSGDAATLGDVTATGGNLAITAGNSAGATVNGAITTQDLSATNGDIDIESVGGSNIATGTIDARNVAGDDTRANIAINTAGFVSTGAINAGVTDAALVGSLTVGGGTTPDTVTFGGEVVADAIDVVSNTDIITGDLTTLATDVTLDAGTRISTQNVSAEGDATLDAGTSIDFATVMAGDSASLDAGTFINGGSVTAGVDAILDAGTTVATGAVSAADDVVITAVDRMTLASVTADSDGSGMGSVSLSSTEGPLTVSGATSGVTVSVVSGGNATLGFDRGVLSLTRSTGGLLDIDAAGAIRTGQIQAIGGNAELTSSTASITTDSVSATADAVLDAETSISSQDAVAGRDVLITAGTSVTSLNITAGRDVSLGAGTTIGAQAVAAGNAITANSAGATILASATADSDGNGAGSLDLTSTNGPLTVTGAARGVSVDIDSGGAVTLGSARSTGGNVTIDAIGNLVTGPVTSSANLLIGQMDAPANVRFSGASSVVGDVTITSDGTITVAANSSVAAGSDLLTTSADIDLGSGSLLKAEGDATLTVSQDASRVRLGASASNGGGAFALTDAELNRIEAQNLLLQANSTNVEVSSVTFDGAAGSESFTVATTGDIAFTGVIDGSGTGGLFQFGGSAPDTGLAGTISMNTEQARLAFAGADLQLRADDILFGTRPFIQEMIDLRDGSGSNFSGLLGALIVGNSGSSLYNAGLDYSGPATYLEASNLNVVYGDSALFQNSGEVSTALVETTGVNISQTLTIDPTDTTNAFAIFGTIETLEGRAAALADPSIVILLDDDEVQPFASRINGCQIRSGADCLNTVIGNTIVEISSEQFDLFSSESDVLLPFDPLVGTNNEGLFSDVGPECEEFDENGICITPSEEQ